MSEELYSLGDINARSVYLARLPQRQIERLIQAIYAETGDLSFGLDIGQNLHPSDYGTVGYALMNCCSLHRVFSLAAKYKHSLNKGLKIHFGRRGSFYHFRMDNLTESKWMGVILELDFVSSLYLSRFFVGANKQKLVVPQCVRFQHDAFASPSKYQSVFACEVLFNQKVNEIVYAKDVLDIPIRSANPKLLRVMEAKLASRQKELDTLMSLKSEVSQFVIESIHHALPSIAEVAKQFNMGVSTFKKRLNNEGSNYREIVDRVREKLALKLISNSSLSIQSIANDLQFSNVNAFNRAFKRWTDMTPARYRKTLDLSNQT